MSSVPNQNSYSVQNQGYYCGRGRGSPGQGGVKRRMGGRGSGFSGMFVHKSNKNILFVLFVLFWVALSHLCLVEDERVLFPDTC